VCVCVRVCKYSRPSKLGWLAGQDPGYLRWCSGVGISKAQPLIALVVLHNAQGHITGSYHLLLALAG